VLRFDQSATMDEQFAAAAAAAARGCLDEHSVRLSDVDRIVAAPPRAGFRAALSDRLGVPVEMISIADHQRIHTAALAAAYEQQAERLPEGAQILFVAAGAGVTAGAALYRQPPRA